MPPGPPRRIRDERFGLLAIFVLAGFALVVLGLLQLQVVEHDALSRLSQQNRIRLDVLRAPRGTIRDRSGRLLADNQPAFNIIFRPMPAESVSRARALISSDWLARVAALLVTDTLDVKKRVQDANRTGQSAMLRRNAPYAVMAAVEETRSDLPGIDVQVAPIRRYPEGSLAAQLLGYAGEVNDRELTDRAEQGYHAGDLIGKTGVERRYEELLRGVDGAEFVVVNAMGKRVSTLSEGPPRPPTPGRDITLTIDLDIQRAMEEAMTNVQHGAAVVLDPRDGSVLGMVSKPNFDPNEFSQGISFARWKELLAGAGDPLLNRAIQSAYPPGSTFKIVTTLAGLHYGVVRAQTHEPTTCLGAFYFGGRRFGCWKRDGHGSLDLIDALAKSCDVYFYQLGLSLGLDRMQAIGQALGLGERTGIDLPAERRGLIPNQAFYDKTFGVGRSPRGVLLNIGIGQGELLCTPLQLATMTSVAANGGHAIRPHVVMSVVGDREFKIEKPTSAGLVTDGANWAALREGMEKVVTDGTAAAVRIPGLPVGGKTGTAQNPHGNDHALFVCYAPADNPTFAMAIVAENAGHGGVVSAPIAALVLRRTFLRDSTATAPIVRTIVDTTEVGD